ncbi:CDP-glycerol glycerophosphotransferase family protein [Nitrincola alkalilacustris]|uniref:CDP-glycerol glycerophosphotransferase family protein n=1 Tax=Nitrincola alkalilacustris TaxID=1571224 RepID=UPI00124F712A|nr:CDP-glycerol glycerophosphotransferase family protein [Nitrincola alkalilacustris]
MKLKISSLKAITIILVIISHITIIVPCKKKLIIFSQSRNRYSGNSRYLFEEIAKEKLNVFWLYSSKEQLKKIPVSFHSRCIKRNSFTGIVTAIRAEFAFISHGSGDFGKLWHLIKNRNITNLWHAIGIKYVGLLDKKLSEKDLAKHRREIKYYNTMIASSDIDKYLTAVCHGIDPKKVLLTGLPKSDQYIKRKKNHKSSRIKILYAPTFRDYEIDRSLFFRLSGYTEEKLISMLDKNPDHNFYLRPHPNDFISVSHAQHLEELTDGRVVNYSQEKHDDIDETLHEFDIIITDYSSIYIEPLLFDTPCIFIPFDIDKYQETRGLAYDYDLITPGPKISKFEDLTFYLENIDEIKTKWRSDREHAKKIFHKYQDGNSCKRIIKEIIK